MTHNMLVKIAQLQQFVDLGFSVPSLLLTLLYNYYL